MRTKQEFPALSCALWGRLFITVEVPPLFYCRPIKKLRKVRPERVSSLSKATQLGSDRDAPGTQVCLWSERGRQGAAALLPLQVEEGPRVNKQGRLWELGRHGNRCSLGAPRKSLLGPHLDISPGRPILDLWPSSTFD